MNEPIRKKALEIIHKRAKKGLFGGITFSSESDAIKSLVDFAKYYDKIVHETKKQRIAEGDNYNEPMCAVCKKEYYKSCLCDKI